jgi:hypothetical protein
VGFAVTATVGPFLCNGTRLQTRNVDLFHIYIYIYIEREREREYGTYVIIIIIVVVVSRRTRSFTSLSLL